MSLVILYECFVSSALLLSEILDHFCFSFIITWTHRNVTRYDSDSHCKIRRGREFQL